MTFIRVFFPYVGEGGGGLSGASVLLGFQPRAAPATATRPPFSQVSRTQDQDVQETLGSYSSARDGGCAAPRKPAPGETAAWLPPSAGLTMEP
ncbi:hypothetical protein [Actinoallomurus sp. NPDC050550]|uniref:hypothetical protein n=1 Tax=Actinoallomurus sp. NPDC050550 TaxID=3154937 RepID=UPI0033E225DF